MIGSRRKSLVYGSLIVTGVVWLTDRFAGRGPASAEATPSAAAPASSGRAAAPASPAAIDDVLAALRSEPLAADSGFDPAQLPNPFALRHALPQLFDAGPDAGPDGVAQNAGESPGAAARPGAATRPARLSPAEEFAARHTLHAVLDGPQPVALIDQMLCSRGAVLDAFELVEIARDSVRLIGPSGEEIRLRAPAPGDR